MATSPTDSRNVSYISSGAAGRFLCAICFALLVVWLSKAVGRGNSKIAYRIEKKRRKNTLLSHHANSATSRNISELFWQTSSIQPPLGLPGYLDHLGLHEATTDLVHGHASAPDNAESFRIIQVKPDYEELQEGCNGVSEPRLSGLIKLYASTSSATEMGRKRRLWAWRKNPFSCSAPGASCLCPLVPV